MTSHGHRLKDAMEIRAEELFSEWRQTLEVDYGVEWVLDYIGWRIEVAREKGEHDVFLDLHELCNDNQFEKIAVWKILDQKGYNIEIVDSRWHRVIISWECKYLSHADKKRLEERVNERCKQYYFNRTSRKARREELWSDDNRQIQN